MANTVTLDQWEKFIARTQEQAPHLWICETQKGKEREVVVMSQKQFEEAYAQTNCLSRLFGTNSIRKISFTEIVTYVEPEVIYESKNPQEFWASKPENRKYGPIHQLHQVYKDLEDIKKNPDQPDIAVKLDSSIKDAERKLGYYRPIVTALKKMNDDKVAKRTLACKVKDNEGLTDKIARLWNTFIQRIWKKYYNKTAQINRLYEKFPEKTTCIELYENWTYKELAAPIQHIGRQIRNSDFMFTRSLPSERRELHKKWQTFSPRNEWILRHAPIPYYLSEIRGLEKALAAIQSHKAAT